MARKMKKSIERERLEQERQEQIKIDPLAAGERYRAQLGMAADKAVRAVNSMTGDGLLKAFNADRLYVGFSHDMAQAAENRIYEVRWTLRERLGSDFLRRQFAALKHNGSLPPVEQSPLAKQIIQAIGDQGQKPSPKVFEGESEYRQHLQGKGLVEAQGDDYKSQVRPKLYRMEG